MAKAQYMGPIVSMTAEAAIERGQIVAVGTWPGVVKTANDAALALGIAMSDAATGEQVAVSVVRGIYTVTGTATAGNRLSCDANGKVKAVANTKPSIGYALETAADAPLAIVFDGSNSINTTS